MSTIVGYTYKAENMSASDLVGWLYSDGFRPTTAGGRLGLTIEKVLDELAAERGIDRQDQHSFDSEDFPKVIFEDQLTCSDQNWCFTAPNHVIDDGAVGPEAAECKVCGDPVHFGHTARIGNHWWCDTCNSPLCDLA